MQSKKDTINTLKEFAGAASIRCSIISLEFALVKVMATLPLGQSQMIRSALTAALRYHCSFCVRFSLDFAYMG